MYSAWAKRATSRVTKKINTIFIFPLSWFFIGQQRSNFFDYFFCFRQMNQGKYLDQARFRGHPAIGQSADEPCIGQQDLTQPIGGKCPEPSRDRWPIVEISANEMANHREDTDEQFLQAKPLGPEAIGQQHSDQKATRIVIGSPFNFGSQSDGQTPSLRHTSADRSKKTKGGQPIAGSFLEKGANGG